LEMYFFFFFLYFSVASACFEIFVVSRRVKAAIEIGKPECLTAVMSERMNESLTPRHNPLRDAQRWKNMRDCSFTLGLNCSVFVL